VSVLVTFELFVRPAVAALQGLPDPLPAYRRGSLAAAVRRDPRRDQLLRAVTRRDGDKVFLEPLPGQESHMIVRAGRADALVLVETGEGELPAGERVLWLALS
jgi:molybdopterin molybdotransferase